MYNVVCHAVLLYDEDLGGYRFLVVGVHGFVFEECRLARHFCLLLLHYSTIYLQYMLYYAMQYYYILKTYLSCYRYC